MRVTCSRGQKKNLFLFFLDHTIERSQHAGEEAFSVRPVPLFLRI